MTPIVTEKDVRMFTMDKPELNTLVTGVKFNSEDIDTAAVYVIDYFNHASPPINAGYTIENFPYRYLLLLGITAHLLRGAAVNEAINQFDYSVDGVQVNDKNRSQLFASLGNAYWEEFKEMAMRIKVNANVAAAFGAAGSEYSYRVF